LIDTRRKAVLGVEQWAEIRPLKLVYGLSQPEIHRRTGVHRDTIRRALASAEPPRYGSRPPRSSKLDRFVPEIERVPADEPRLSGVRVREEIAHPGYEGGKTIVAAAIVPRNAPVLLASLKVAMALCTGNTLVLKAAEDTPLGVL